MRRTIKIQPADYLPTLSTLKICASGSPPSPSFYKMCVMYYLLYIYKQAQIRGTNIHHTGFGHRHIDKL
ncbi:unnamed protein product [Meloidogyne enterolobii]|uniref:Uncharacterized protein n=1 Tax=Meloidogyne enterolobii TaxID=390850 RepID=A0ACB0XUT9_MELEN